MLGLRWIGIVIGLFAAQAGQGTTPAYVREGDRVEQEFRAYRTKLDAFYTTLHSTIARDIPVLMTELEGAPPQPVVYGYQLLPHIVDNGPLDRKPVESFSYSWPITRGYIDGEGIKLERAQAEMLQALKATGIEKSALLLALIAEYKSLVDDQRVIDQYIQYNRLWQRTITEDRVRYDEMTKLLKLMQAADPDIAGSIRQMLGQPLVPSSITMSMPVVAEGAKPRVVLHVPVYTDIESDGYLEQVKASVQKVWQAEDADAAYSIEVEFRKLSADMLYDGKAAPKHGDHVDVKVHVAHFPSDGVVLTTGAEITNAIVKRYIALGPGDISQRTLAHEFGHLLGFPDGYIRGYKDLGDKGLEILELTSVFDDIMSAPREGVALPAHFKLIVEAIKAREQ